jgi:hypothetical protein
MERQVETEAEAHAGLSEVVTLINVKLTRLAQDLLREELPPSPTRRRPFWDEILDEVHRSPDGCRHLADRGLGRRRRTRGTAKGTKTGSLETAAAAIADQLRIAEEALVRLTAEAARRRRSVDPPPGSDGVIGVLAKS